MLFRRRGSFASLFAASSLASVCEFGRECVREKAVFWPLVCPGRGCVTVPRMHSDSPYHSRGRHLGDAPTETPECTLASVAASLISHSKWTPDSACSACGICKKAFTFTRRRHHCRHCGKIFCHDCSQETFPLDGIRPAARVCDLCFFLLDGTRARDPLHFAVCLCLWLDLSTVFP